MANLFKTILVVAFVSTASAVTPIDATGVANYCETSVDCGGTVKSGYSCGWYKRHLGAMEGRCIPTKMCGLPSLEGEAKSVMECPDVAAL